MNSAEFTELQNLPYYHKKTWALFKAREFYETFHGNVYVSVGGLDSIALLTLLRKEIDKNIPGVSVSSLEDKSVQKIHHQLDNMTILTPYKSKVQVINEFGFPALSKESAKKIEALQKPTPKNATYRRAILTGVKGDGTFEKRMMLAKKWIDLFYQAECPFKVSPKCCYYMKEKPLIDFAKQNKIVPFTGLMVSEGGNRAKGLKKNGCNYYSEKSSRSAPFTIFKRTDVLQLALEYNAPVPEAYGQIIKLPNNTLETTKAKRTGCACCGFGIQLEKRPHRFDRMRQDSYKEWRFWMYDCVTDRITHEKYGWGRVLDRIGVKWRDIPDTKSA